jgi:ribonuclease HI
MTYYHRVILYFDGASRNNPHGPAGCGWVLREMDRHGTDGDYIASGKRYLGYNVSNNQAEYEGLTEGLDYISDYIECDGLYIRGDAEIVVRQMMGEYEVRSPNIRPYYNDAQSSLARVCCDFYYFRHVSRCANWEADELANEAIGDYA